MITLRVYVHFAVYCAVLTCGVLCPPPCLAVLLPDLHSRRHVHVCCPDVCCAVLCSICLCLAVFVCLTGPDLHCRRHVQDPALLQHTHPRAGGEAWGAGGGEKKGIVVHSSLCRE
jgi:hypothetical protein